MSESTATTAAVKATPAKKAPAPVKETPKTPKKAELGHLLTVIRATYREADPAVRTACKTELSQAWKEIDAKNGPGYVTQVTKCRKLAQTAKLPETVKACDAAISAGNQLAS